MYCAAAASQQAEGVAGRANSGVDGPGQVIADLQAGDPLTRVRRIRLIDGAIVGLHDAYFVLPRGALLAQEQVERTQSLYRLLIEEFGFVPADAVESISPALADRDDAKLLQVKEGSPCLFVNVSPCRIGANRSNTA